MIPVDVDGLLFKGTCADLSVSSLASDTSGSCGSSFTSGSGVSCVCDAGVSRVSDAGISHVCDADVSIWWSTFSRRSSAEEWSLNWHLHRRFLARRLDLASAMNPLCIVSLLSRVF